MKKFLMMSFVSLAMFLMATPTFAQSVDGICHVTYKEFKNVSPIKAKIIDARTAEEYQEGHLKNAANIDVLQSDFKDKIEKLDKNAKYYVYCKAGTRSAKAAAIMQSEGFAHVCSIDGGILHMEEEGVELVK